MRVSTAALSLLLLLATGVHAEELESDVLLETLAKWAQLARAELKVEGAPEVHRAWLASFDGEFFNHGSSFGTVTSESSQRRRPTKVEVVVGSDQLDSSRFKPDPRTTYTSYGQQVWQRPSLTIEGATVALERDLWAATDKSYKAAVKQFRAKAAALATHGGAAPPPDWTSAPAVQHVERSSRVVDEERLRRLGLAASAALGELPGLHQGDAWVNAVEGHSYLATSGGTLLVQPEGFTSLWVRASVVRSDGVEVEDERIWLGRTAADLPGLPEIERTTRQLGQSVLARRDAEIVDYYEGAVLFEGPAAADFLRYLVSPEMRATPPPPQADKTFQELTRGGPRLGRKLLPTGWSVVDDPSAFGPGQAGAYLYDREGVLARRTVLVEDGYVRGFVRSRIPRGKDEQSNGHARGDIQSDWQSRLSAWTVTPDRNLRSQKLDKEVERVRAASGSDRILVIRRTARGRSGTLGRPTDAVWRLADGSEVPVVALLHQNVDRRTLRDIAAAGGGEQEHPYLGAADPTRWAAAGRGLPMLLRAPRMLLVENMELAFPGPDEDPPSLAPPERRTVSASRVEAP